MITRFQSRAGVALVIAVAPAGVWPGCGRSLPSAVPRRATYVYACPDGFRFSARVRGDSAAVAVPAQMFTLPRVVSASGARFESGGVVLWSQGEEARLEMGADVHPACQGVPAANPWEEARLLGVEFRAVGQEPGWTVDVDQGRWLRFLVDYGQTCVLTPAPDPVRDTASGTITYAARTEAHELVLVAREAPCHDTMSGEAFPYQGERSRARFAAVYLR